MSLPVLRESLGDSKCLIEFALSGDQWGAWLISSKGVDFIELDCDSAGLRELVTRLYFFLEKHAYPYPYAQHNSKAISVGTRLYLERIARAIWYPLEGSLGKHDQLIIVPSHLLSTVPLHALSGEKGVPLFTQYRLELADSSQNWLERQQNTKREMRSGVVFFPNSAPGGPAEAERDAIKRAFPDSELIEGTSARRTLLIKALSRPHRFIHVISHASISIANPFCSEILLSDGPFYAFDLYGTPVCAGLVTLSGCQTGRPGFFGELNTAALADTFVAAGAQAAIGSLWPVSDVTTAGFMGKMYASWAEKNDIYSSWRQAIAYINKKDDNPYYWAPFRLSGRVDW